MGEDLVSDDDDKTPYQIDYSSSEEPVYTSYGSDAVDWEAEIKDYFKEAEVNESFTSEELVALQLNQLLQMKRIELFEFARNEKEEKELRLWWHNKYIPAVRKLEKEWVGLYFDFKTVKSKETLITDSEVMELYNKFISDTWVKYRAYALKWIGRRIGGQTRRYVREWLANNSPHVHAYGIDNLSEFEHFEDYISNDLNIEAVRAIKYYIIMDYAHNEV